MEAMQLIKQYKLVPVVVFNDISEVVPTLGALEKGGLPVAEITFRTDCAAEAIRLAVEKCPGMLIGAGTVICRSQCEDAIDAGAKFIVGPGLSEAVAETCEKRGVPYIPGVITPTEVIKAIGLGLTVLKFFPASDFGGLKTIKALSAAFPQVTFMPTGGINENNLTEYLSFPKIAACGGSWMMKGSAADIENKTREAMKMIGGIK